MSLSIMKNGGRVVAGIAGQLIVTNRHELKQEILDELEMGETKFLLDLSDTGYIDSSGLGLLVSLSEWIRERGGELRLANLNDDLRNVFALTKFDTTLEFEPT